MTRDLLRDLAHDEIFMRGMATAAATSAKRNQFLNIAGTLHQAQLALRSRDHAEKPIRNRG